MILKVRIAIFSAVALSLISYISIQHIINPVHVYQLIGYYILAFGAYAVFLNPKLKLNIWQLFIIGLVFRLIMFSQPTLSDDFYRFYWDGKLFIEGINPYSLTPKKLLGTEVYNIEIINESLYELLNSKEYYSVYPPLLQYIFGISAMLGKSLQGFVTVMSLFVLVAEIGTFFLLKKLLEIFKLPLNKIGIYWLNPLTIMELCGNLHGEVFMILAVTAALYFYKTKKALLIGIALSIAVLTKLYPILFVPFFLIPYNLKVFIKTMAGLTFGILLLALPILNLEYISNIVESVSLYYAKFEFNGSIYNLMKLVGYKISGYNQIAVIGKILSVLTIAGFGVLYFLRLKSTSKFPITLSIYLGMLIFYLFSTTVMPWYLSLIVLLSIFNSSKVGLVWSALVVLSYTAFENIHFKEDSALVMIEYYTIAVIIFLELRKYHRQRIFESN